MTHRQAALLQARINALPRLGLYWLRGHPYPQQQTFYQCTKTER